MLHPSLRSILGLLTVGNAIYMSVAICYGESGEEINSFLREETRSGQDATFVCCGGSWDAKEIEWQKSLDVKGTRWCGHWDKLRTFIEENAVYGVRTLIMTYRHRGSPESCIDPVLKHYKFWYAAKWLVFGHFETCVPSPCLIRSRHMKLYCCVASAKFLKSGMITIEIASNQSREYQRPETDHSLGYHRGESFPRSLVSLSGKRIKIACRVLPGVSHIFSSCETYERIIIQEALALLNATVVKIAFSAGSDLNDYRAEEIEIFMFFQKIFNDLLTVFDVPLVNEIGAFTFYVKKSSMIPVTAGYALAGSKLLLIFLVLCLAFCFVTLVFTDVIDATTSGIAVANDTMLFLVATFFSTACDLKASTRFCTSRRLVILAWALGSFSLSVYFKGQLTSWLVARIPEPIVDDLIKLETALDAHAIRPCILRDTPWNLRVLDSYDTVVLSKLERSLDPQEEEVTLAECFKCASKKGRLCISVRQRPCFMRSMYPKITDSKDPLGLVYAGVPVRKHYRLKMAFRSLVQRVQETDWLHMANMECVASQPKEEMQPAPEALNFFGVAQFVLPCFGVSAFVLFLEVLFGRYFCLRAGRLTKVRAV